MSGVSRRDARALAADGLRAAITSGAVRPEEAIREEDWARRLGVSRTPIREAIGELVTEGLLTKRGRTAHVFHPSLEELLEIYDIRLALEKVAGRFCAENADDALVAELTRRFEAIRVPRSDADWFRDHERFHMAIFEGSARPRLVAMIRTLRVQSEPYVRHAVHVDRRFRDHSKVHHRAMVTAIRARDAAAIENVITEHLLTSREEISKLLADGWSGLAVYLQAPAKTRSVTGKTS